MKKTNVCKNVIMCLISLFLVFSPFAFSENLENGSSLLNWNLKSESKIDNNPTLIHYVWEIYRPPCSSLDKVVLHRVVNKNRPPGGGKNKDKAIFMLPGTWNAGGWSEITDPNINTMLFLANNGYDVYTMDYRTINVPDMAYDQFSEYQIDIASTADWNYAVFVEDVEVCVNKIMSVSGAKKLFMSGFSRGATIMFIYASKYPHSLKGLVSLDGTIKDFPPSGTALDEATYNQMIAAFKAGQLPNPYEPGEMIEWITGVDTDYYDSWKLAESLPYAKNLAGGTLPTEFNVISDFVADDAYHLWIEMGFDEGAFTNYYGGYIDRDVLVKVLNEFTRYYPSVQTLEDLQMAAHDDVPYFDYDDNDVYLPAIAFSTKLTCPQYVCLIDAIPNMTKSDDVTIIYLEGCGHMDVMFGTHSLNDVKTPLLQWLNNHR